MTMRKTEARAIDLCDRVNELSLRRTLLGSCRNELNDKKALLAKGDTSVMPRIKELFDLIEMHNAWIERNLPIIQSMMKVS